MFDSRYLSRLLDMLHRLYPDQKLRINLYQDSDNDDQYLEVLTPSNTTVCKVHESGETWMKINGVLDKIPQAVTETQQAEEDGRFSEIIKEY